MNTHHEIRNNPPIADLLNLSTRSSYLAIDASRYHVRVAHATADGLILQRLEVRPDKVRRIVNFVRTIKRDHPTAILAGVRTDQWPPELLQRLHEFGAVTWISDYLQRRTRGELRRCLHLLRFYRATFIARGAAEGRYPTRQRVDLAMTHWKQAIVDDLKLEFLGLLDDIPF